MKNRWKVGIFLEIEKSIETLFEARKRINYEISTQLRSHRVSKPNLLRNIDFTLTLFTLSLHIDSPSSRVPTSTTYTHIYDTYAPIIINLRSFNLGNSALEFIRGSIQALYEKRVAFCLIHE